MNSKTGSLLALLVAVLGIFFLITRGYVFSKNVIALPIQAFAALLMLWARITFGLRSFHAAATTTEGKLVVNGPYRLLRHPIYASLIYFFWASVIAYPYIETLAAVIVITAGLFIRMLLEEKHLLSAYPEYAAYAKRTKRIIPFLF